MFNHELKKAITSNKLIIFIGAGLSKKCGLPLWKEIVEKVLEREEIEKRESYSNALQSEILSALEVLDKLESNYKKIVYEVFQEETSKKLNNEIYKKIKLLSKKIITTNYDSLIEHNTGIREIDTSSNFNLSKLDSLDEYVFKIHGTHSNIDNSVIFSKDYENLYNENGKLSKFQLDKLISGHTCLFIGFSLTDLYIVNLFRYLQNIYSNLGPKHYIISTENIPYDFVETIKIESHTHLDEKINDLLDFCRIHKSEIDNEKEFSEIVVKKKEVDKYYGADTAPAIDDWTGRHEELKALSNEQRAFFITGIGGQGKSTLASKFLSISDKNIYEYREWKDFKEEDLNFQTKLYSLISLVSNGYFNVENLNGLSTHELIDIFFKSLGIKKGIFVFDNIDKYIDLNKFLPAGDMAIFFEMVMKAPHNSKFIFTCRPFIQYAAVGSHHIKLEGLNLDDAKYLLGKYHSNIDKDDFNSYCLRLHNATNGHPLWMALTIAQSRDDINNLNDIIQKIENRNISESDVNYSSTISKTVLSNLWQNLKEREKVILRALSVSAISESEDELSNVLKSKINYKEFSRGMRSLKLLSLVIKKENNNYVELHPLVREFIVSNYGRDEQDSYISLYVKYLNGFILLLQEKFGKKMNSDDIEKIIKKIEITTNSKDYQDSINELRRSWDSMIVSGYAEDVLRISDNLLARLDWNSKKLNEIKGFFEFIDLFFTKSSEFGRKDLFQKYMDKYTKIYTNADRSMILAKSCIARNAWHEKNFTLAIKEGKSASDLIDLLGENEVWRGKHIYNLSLRDSKIESNIDQAIKYFSDGIPLEDVFINSTSAQVLGNIGRSLLYKNKHSQSIKFLCKSYSILKNSTNDYFSQHNLGYASLWISEFLEETSLNKESLYFQLNTRNIWEKDIPHESNKINYKLSKPKSNEEQSSIINLESWQITKYCDDWVKDKMESISLK